MALNYPFTILKTELFFTEILCALVAILPLHSSPSQNILQIKIGNSIFFNSKVSFYNHDDLSLALLNYVKCTYKPGVAHCNP